MENGEGEVIATSLKYGKTIFYGIKIANVFTFYSYLSPAAKKVPAVCKKSVENS